MFWNNSVVTVFPADADWHMNRKLEYTLFSFKYNINIFVLQFVIFQPTLWLFWNKNVILWWQFIKLHIFSGDWHFNRNSHIPFVFKCRLFTCTYNMHYVYIFKFSCLTYLQYYCSTLKYLAVKSFPCLSIYVLTNLFTIHLLLI